MKMFIRLVLTLLALFSLPTFAQVETKMEGSGNTVDAVKAFNKAVAFSGGKVEGGAVTEYSSSGDFGEYHAKMTVEVEGKKAFIHIITESKRPDIFKLLIGMEGSDQMAIAVKISENMKKSGYVLNLPPPK